jgi:hypothetical protein
MHTDGLRQHSRRQDAGASQAWPHHAVHANVSQFPTPANTAFLLFAKSVQRAATAHTTPLSFCPRPCNLFPLFFVWLALPRATPVNLATPPERINCAPAFLLLRPPDPMITG